MSVHQTIADLHNHSTHSDGEYSPTELVHKARELGLKAVALTDHDTIDGVPETAEAARKAGLIVVPGVEVTLRFRRPFFVGSLHLLLYFSDEILADPVFRQRARDTFGKGRGPALVRARVHEINAQFGPESVHPILKRPLSQEEVAEYSANVTRRHFALALAEKHDIEDKAVINALIGNNSPAYVPSGMDMGDLKPLLDEYPLVRVLAHPAAGSFPGESHYKEVLPPLETVEKLLPEFLDEEILGLDGLEVYYPGHTPEHGTLLTSWAEKHRLLVTGGSDCHDSSVRPLGSAGVTREELDRLLARIGNVN